MISPQIKVIFHNRTSPQITLISRIMRKILIIKISGKSFMSHLFEAETYKIIRAAQEVNKELGSAFLEIVYQDALQSWETLGMTFCNKN